MYYAINKNKERITPEPSIEAFCPGCSEKLISKCGSINVWHFSHKNKDCDSWYEPETEWHRNWKEFFPVENREVVIQNHRADIKNNMGIIVELQNSSISSEEIKERENFYHSMMWIINGEEFFDKNITTFNKGDYYTFRWKQPRKCWFSARCPVYIDIGSKMLFRLNKIHAEVPCYGWGKYHGKEWLLEQLGIKQGTYNIYKL